MYNPCPKCGGFKVHAESDLPPGVDAKIKKEVTRIMGSIWDGKRPVTDAKLLKIVGGLLESQVISGFGKNFNQVDFDTPDAEMLTRLTRDVWHFASAKNYQQLRDMTLALRDDEGKLREFPDFKDACYKINNKFNGTWLKTEYNQAIGSAIMAAKYNDFVKNAKIMPFLKYLTVGDDRVRYEHAALDGIIRKITDAFWRTHYPPNGWGCRCDVVQLATSVAKETETIPDVKIDPLFRTNLAASGLIYPKGHAYYDGVPDDVLREAIQYLPADAAYKPIYKADKGTIEMHLLHGLKEAMENVKTAKLLADADYNVKLLPVLGEKDDKAREFIYGTKNFIPGKNPDALVDNKIAEFKAPTKVSKSAIHNAIKHGERQSDFVIIHLQEKINNNDLDRFVLGKMKQALSIKDVWVFNGSEGLKKYNKP